MTRVSEKWPGASAFCECGKKRSRGSVWEKGDVVHELGITQGIIDRARDAAVENDAKKVTDVYVVMTPAADFAEDSIDMYFTMLTQDDELFLGAALHVEHRPVSGVCLDCSDEFSVDAPQPVCPQCGSYNVRLDPEAPRIQLTDVAIDE